ncbi:MAG: hypothetical protein HY897_21230 [Deltaproteobacteria bacterium]|nr:hypothetical protein [Deltaproteobacteria bacterium]
MGRKEDLLIMLMEKRVGFKADEVMSGTHRFVGGAGPVGELPFEFKVTWGPRRLGKFLNPLDADFMLSDLAGTVTVGGLCDDASCEGRLEFRYVEEAKIRYIFDFDAGGKRYHYVGEKRDLRPWNLHKTHTTCYGTLTEADTGKVVSESTTYFRLSTAIPFMLSFRWG